VSLGPDFTASVTSRSFVIPATGDVSVARDPEAVVAFYSRFSRLYELWGRCADSRARRRVLELCAVTDGDDVLEVASGPGAQLIALARQNRSGRTIGVELAAGMIKEASRRVQAAGVDHRVELRIGDACLLPLPDNSIDVLTSAYMLDILPEAEIRRALTEFVRVLRPGGRLVLCSVTPGERRRHRLGDLLYDSPLPLTSNCRGIQVAPLLHDLGLVAIRREYRAQYLLPSEIVWARTSPGQC
jgi:demethylmenaquinone methyltransferase/2-methoxy-6-polyprenyl-1,4-benzoquinol methylase